MRFRSSLLLRHQFLRRELTGRDHLQYHLHRMDHLHRLVQDLRHIESLGAEVLEAMARLCGMIFSDFIQMDICRVPPEWRSFVLRQMEIAH